MTPDVELIARTLAEDDRTAFGELVQRHQSAVRSFLRHLTQGDAALADDLAQESFVLAYGSLGRFHGASSFLTWLLGIARNQWRNARRRQHDTTALSNEMPVETGATVNVADLRHDLGAALQQLSPDEQLAIHLGFQQGLSHREIADLLGWPIGTVKTHLARGKDKLREHLAVWNPRT